MYFKIKQLAECWLRPSNIHFRLTLLLLLLLLLLLVALRSCENNERHWSLCLVIFKATWTNVLLFLIASKTNQLVIPITQKLQECLARYRQV